MHYTNQVPVCAGSKFHELIDRDFAAAALSYGFQKQAMEGDAPDDIHACPRRRAFRGRSRGSPYFCHGVCRAGR